MIASAQLLEGWVPFTECLVTFRSEVCRYQFFESVSDPYPQRTIRIRTFLQLDICIRYDSFSCIQSTDMIEAN